MSVKTSHRRTARKRAEKLLRDVEQHTGYATFGPHRSGTYATFGLPYTVRAAR